jgi:uncharacterized protein YprB with RNaseH-like and TPR domain
MIPDELRRKLEDLNRGPLKIDPAAPRGLPRREKPVILEEHVQGEIIGGPDRPFFLIRRPLEELFDRAGQLTREFRGVWRGRHALTEKDLQSPWPEVLDTDPTRLVFLDIETLGLTATPVFLIGTLCLDEDHRFRVRQFFARNYSEEPHVLAHFAGFLRGCDGIVTFNGRSFDWPYLRDRATYHRLELGDEPEHLDLLHEARRRWRSVLPNCQLQTLEYHVAGRRRQGDLPGSMIPEAYHAYVKTGNARLMLDVIHHNALDLITMLELMLFILQGGEIAWE